MNSAPALETSTRRFENPFEVWNVFGAFRISKEY